VGTVTHEEGKRCVDDQSESASEQQHTVQSQVDVTCCKDVVREPLVPMEINLLTLILVSVNGAQGIVFDIGNLASEDAHHDDRHEQ
jgi:hypothetical protein